MKKLEIKNAIVSVSDKNKLDLLVPYFEKFKVKIFSSGGTYKYLKKLSSKIKLFEISTITNFPEILGGRVKTLHPAVHSGILADKNNNEHLKQISKLNLLTFDLIIVNLYPFSETIKKSNQIFKECIENIDIGGSTLIRAAAKNLSSTAVLSDPKDYENFVKLAENNRNFFHYDYRKSLAIKAFQKSAFYESQIAKWFSSMNKKDLFGDELALPFKKIKELRYGENPHQQAALYELGRDNINQLSGKEMSLNNVNDMNIAIELALEFNKDFSCVILKHGNPCGVSVSNKQENAYKNALKSDPVSAFGGIVAFNKKLTLKTAKLIKENFTEVIIAPKIPKEVTKYLSSKKNLIIIEYRNILTSKENLSFSSTKNHLLVQEQNLKKFKYKDLSFPTLKKPSKIEMEDLKFAFIVAKYVNSNSIVISKKLTTVGIGVGQTNRLDSAKQALKKLQNLKSSKEKFILASDGFFPFPDIVKLCKKYPISSIIQPGGSKNDKLVIEESNKSKISMVFTGYRNFKH
ncbi:MAG: bifunctional phosphoribosylaminoimidazolecarboxamide formyltransferase/IMP cyclohydrolase PurH [Rickettsiales bacterium]|nr:bifunctional phosphoribosylaminoimidazolecarboxamide formyltransferase/IMP cyclohydrolase PurH [Rickettsiales bacterium]